MLTVHGVQGHVAYPQLADNPIRRFAPILAELHQIEWDSGNEYFPPTSFQVVDVRAGVGAPNVTPGELSARFNFRYSTEWTHESSKEKVESVFDAHGIDYELKLASVRRTVPDRTGQADRRRDPGRHRTHRRSTRIIHRRRHIRRSLHLPRR